MESQLSKGCGEDCHRDSSRCILIFLALSSMTLFKRSISLGRNQSGNTQSATKYIAVLLKKTAEMAMAQQAALTEEAFESFIEPRMDMLAHIFGEGNLFSPFLFGEFWDPMEPFALWDLDSSNQQISESLIWSDTDSELGITVDLPGLKKEELQVIVEDGKVLEISGQWQKSGEKTDEGWRHGEWWEVGFIRRFSLPANVNIDGIKASMKDGTLHISIPKSSKPICHNSSCGQVKIININNA